MTRVLFSTVYDPEPLLNRWAATDQMAYRLTRGQGIFTLEEHAHSWPVHLLAQNIEARSVVLEWPSLEELEQELRDADYDYVCITFMNRDLDKLPLMSEAVRRLRPRAKIVIGGYGVICLPDAEKAKRAADHDHICRGEGVHFLRQLLGEADRPVDCRLPQSGAALPWLTRRSRGTVGAALAALGCTQKCPFCVTSFYTKGNLLEVLNVRGLYEAMLYYWDVNPFTSTVNVYDENFLDYKERVDALGRLIREDGRYGLKHLNYFTFGSLSAISRYDPEELLLNGLDTVWIGVESYFTRLRKTRAEDQRGELDIAERNAYTADTFRALHGMGIKTIGSWIMGMDCQNRVNIAQDEEYFLRLGPTFQQISVLTVEPEMPIGRHYDHGGEGRKYPWRNYHLYGQTFEPAELSFGELLDRVDALYRRMYHELGPSLLRMLQCNLNGYRYCRASRNPLLSRDKAAFFERKVRTQATVLPVVAELGPNPAMRGRAREMEREVWELFGRPEAAQQTYRDHLLRKAAAEYELRGDGDRPIRTDAFRRYVYGPQSAAPRGRKPYAVSHTRLRGYEDGTLAVPPIPTPPVSAISAISSTAVTAP
jgi:haloalkane dehalogenase